MAAEITTDNPYGIIPALQQGGFVTMSLFAILVFMSAGSWYIIITRWLEQRRVFAEARAAEAKVWSAANVEEGVSRLAADSAFRQIADDGLRAQKHFAARMADGTEIGASDWVSMAFNRSASLIATRLGKGLSFLASVGSVSPFIGLLGTVIGIYRALINIGMAGQASIDKVAGPVGEALIMTAIGLFVAVPAVLGYNYLAGRNKLLMERLNLFAADIHSYLFSGARIARPAATTAAARPAAAKPAGK